VSSIIFTYSGLFLINLKLSVSFENFDGMATGEARRAFLADWRSIKIWQADRRAERERGKHKKTLRKT